MLVIVTRDLPDRFRGFLASVMLEIGPGVYTGPQITAGVRERIWAVLKEWFLEFGGGSLVMTWTDASSPGKQTLRCLGIPPREFVEMEGLIMTRTDISAREQEILDTFSRLGAHSPGGASGDNPNKINK